MRTRRFLRCLAVAFGFTISSLATVVVHPAAAQTLRQSADKVELLSGELCLPVSLRCPSFAFNTAVVGGTQMPGQMSGNLLAGEELVVGDAGDGNVCDHADFGDAKLLRE